MTMIVCNKLAEDFYYWVECMKHMNIQFAQFVNLLFMTEFSNIFCSEIFLENKHPPGGFTVV